MSAHDLSGWHPYRRLEIDVRDTFLDVRRGFAVADVLRLITLYATWRPIFVDEEEENTDAGIPYRRAYHFGEQWYFSLTSCAGTVHSHCAHLRSRTISILCGLSANAVTLECELRFDGRILLDAVSRPWTDCADAPPTAVAFRLGPTTNPTWPFWHLHSRRDAHHAHCPVCPFSSAARTFRTWISLRREMYTSLQPLTRAYRTSRDKDAMMRFAVQVVQHWYDHLFRCLHPWVGEIKWIV